jgi:CMP-N,N'-diacetyllegionaminic acid synthase
MIQGKSVLAIIPARGGSKGVPRKNIKRVGGKPLIAWTIEEARKSVYIDRLIVSTEDEEIAEVARQYGCEVPFMRPIELAQDDTPGIDPALHAIRSLPPFDFVVLLQPTSPLRTVSDIDGAIEKCMANGASACVSVTLADKTPYWMYHLESDGRMNRVLAQSQTITRRQDAPEVYVLNGAVYVGETKTLQQYRSFLTEETIAYVMPNERSLDIDTAMDFVVVEAVLAQRRYCD